MSRKSGLSGRRGIGAALAVTLLTGTCTAAAGPMAHGLVACGIVSDGTTVSLTCEGPDGRRDRKAEAAFRARSLTPEQARAAGCLPVHFTEGGGLTTSETIGPIANAEPTFTLPVRPIDPQVSARINAAWDRIERRLAANAPTTLGKLGRPATEQQIAAWEHDNANRLPDDLRASLLRHDGADDGFGSGFRVPPEHRLAGLSGITEMHRANCRDLVVDGPPEAADPLTGSWHGSLVPFAAGGSRQLFLRPGDGRIGVKKWNANVRYDGPTGWTSYLALLEAVAGALESGTALHGLYPVVIRCELHWADRPAAAPPAGCADAPGS
ncbi:SMI1/KNR4 family protein [Spongiactinospora sp. 9N601]|uniref:SMI1/KNR4 family protein n=1 Tax=Spongiactinospora sp. 9N601 TaxID=3375149 RepID=UPI0037B0F290